MEGSWFSSGHSSQSEVADDKPPNFPNFPNFPKYPKTMIHLSQIKPGSPVTFPEWRGEKHYMIPFKMSAALPEKISRYQNVVQQMMSGVDVDPNQECYLMVDEKEVLPNNFHRRPGLHVDGYWWPEIQCHGGHSPTPRHSPRPTHAPIPGKHRGQGRHFGSSQAPEGLLLASNYAACRALVGQYERDFEADWRGGDCSDLRTDGLREIQLQANRAYLLDVMTLHESLPIYEPVKRTVIRINVPNWGN